MREFGFLRKLKKLTKIFKIIRSYMRDDESLFLTVLEEEALEALERYKKLGITNTEEIEDLLYHIRSYNEIPKALKGTSFEVLEKAQVTVKTNGVLEVEFTVSDGTTAEEIEAISKYIEYITEVEDQRAVERDFIFEHLKNLPLSFSL